MLNLVLFYLSKLYQCLTYICFFCGFIGYHGEAQADAGVSVVCCLY